MNPLNFPKTSLNLTRTTRYKFYVSSGPYLSAALYIPYAPVLGFCKRNFATTTVSRSFSSNLSIKDTRTLYNINKLFLLMKETSRNDNSLMIFYEHSRKCWIDITSQYGKLTSPSNLMSGREMRYMINRFRAFGFTSTPDTYTVRLQAPVGLIIYVADGPEWLIRLNLAKLNCFDVPLVVLKPTGCGNFDISKFGSIHSVISVDGEGPYILRFAKYLQILFSKYNSINTASNKAISSTYLAKAQFARFNAKWVTTMEGLIVDEEARLVAKVKEEEYFKQKSLNRR